MPGGVTIQVNQQKEPYVFVSKAAEEAKKKRQERLLEIADQKKRLEEERKTETDKATNANTEALDAIDKKLKKDKAEAEKRIKDQFALDMDEMTKDIMSRFPLPSLSLKLIDDDAENLQNSAPGHFQFTFKKSDIATLNETKAYKKNMLFGSNKPNAEFDAVQRDLTEFTALMDQMSEEQTEVDVTKKVARLEVLFEQIQKNCQQYLDDHPGRRSTPTGKARKKLISDTKEIIASKMDVFRQMQIRKEEQLQGSDEELKILQENSVVNLKNNIDEANRDLDKAAEDSKTVQATQHAEALNQITAKYNQEKEKLDKLEEAEKKPVYPKYEIQKVEKDYKFQSILTVDDNRVRPRQKAIHLQAQIAHTFFNQEHNPFLSYRRQFKPGYDIHASICDDSYQAMPKIGEVKTQLNSLNSNVPMTYSIDALLTISNLEQFDHWMGTNRKPQDFHIGYVIKDKDGKEYSMEDMNQLAKKDIEDKGITCIVTNVQAEIINETSDPFEFLESDRLFRFQAGSLGNREILENMTAFRYSKFDGVFSAPDYQKSTLSRRLQNVLRGFEKWNLNDTYFANIYSREELLYSVSAGYIGTKPIRSEYQLSKQKTEPGAFIDNSYQPDFLRRGPAYYDEDLLFQMNKQFVREDYLSDFYIPKDIVEGELYGNKLTLTNRQFEQAFDGLKETKDENLQVIISTIQDAYQRTPQDTVDYEGSHQSAYDRQANGLYKMVNAYVTEHPGTNETKVLQAWLDTTFPKGTLNIQKDPEAYYIDATDTDSDDIGSESKFNGDADLLFSAKLLRADDSVTMYDAKEEPLFTKEPTVGDIRQGKIGNCYFLAHLASTIKTNPNAIKEMMVENPNGTVTCKFYNNFNEPIYVTVNKTYPVSKTKDGSLELATGEKVPLWVSVLEKAYVFSGLRNDKRTDKEAMDLLADKGRKAYAEKDKWPSLSSYGVAKTLIGKRFPGKSYVDDADLKKRVHCMFRHGLLCLSSGNISVLGRHLFGKQTRTIDVDATESKSILDKFQFLDKENRLEEITKALTGQNLNCDKALLGELLTIAGAALRVDKYHGYETYTGRVFPIIKYISLEDVKKSIEKAGKELSAGNVYKKEDVESLVKTFNTEMEKYQSGNPKELKLLSEAPKNYSKATIDLYNTLKLNKNLKFAMSCTFRNINCYDGHQKDFEKNILRSMEQSAVQDHGYSILDVREDENGTKYVQIRNPWGRAGMSRAQMKGRDDTERVTISASGGLSVGNPTGGVFELELNRFVKHAKQITYMKDLNLLAFGSLCGKIAEQYVSYLKKEKADTYNKLMEKCNQDEKKLIAMAAKSKKIHNASKSFLNEFREDLEDGKIIDITEFRNSNILNVDPDNLEPADVKKQNPGFDNPNPVAGNGSVKAI